MIIPIQMSKIFYERFIKGGDITLFSTYDVPGLYEAFGTTKFDALYKKYEKDTTIPRKLSQARTLIGDILKERAETGRIIL